MGSDGSGPIRNIDFNAHRAAGSEALLIVPVVVYRPSHSSSQNNGIRKTKIHLNKLDISKGRKDL